MQRAHRPERAQSTVVSVALLTFVVVLVIGTFGSFYLSSFDRTGPAQADLRVTLNATGAENLTVVHAGGETLDSSAIRVLVRDGTDVTYALDADGAQTPSDTPAAFEPGERWSVDVSGLGLVVGDTVRVLVVDDDTQSVLFDSTVTVDDGR